MNDIAASPGDDEQVRSPSRSERDREIAEELVERASKDGVDLVGLDGLLTDLPSVFSDRAERPVFQASQLHRSSYSPHHGWP